MREYHPSMKDVLRKNQMELARPSYGTHDQHRLGFKIQTDHKEQDFITVPTRQNSKSGDRNNLQHQRPAAKVYKMTRLDDQELQRVLSHSYRSEIRSLRKIETKKLEEAKAPYIEQTKTFNLQFRYKKSIEIQRQKAQQISKTLQENLERSKVEMKNRDLITREDPTLQNIGQSLQAQSKAQSTLLQDQNNFHSAATQANEPTLPDDFKPKYDDTSPNITQKNPATNDDKANGNSQFDYMSIRELQQHERGILNLFEGEQQLKNYLSHNKENIRTNVNRQMASGHRHKAMIEAQIVPKLGRRGFGRDMAYPAMKFARLTREEYEVIFDRNPSFNEKRAFIEVLRRKWKQDKGYTSKFSKIKSYRAAKTRTQNLMMKKMYTEAKNKAKSMAIMLERVAEKRVIKEQQKLAQEFEKQDQLDQLRQKDELKRQKQVKKALRQTESPQNRQRQPTAEMRALTGQKGSTDALIFQIQSSSIDNIIRQIDRTIARSPRVKSAKTMFSGYNRNKNVKSSTGVRSTTQQNYVGQSASFIRLGRPQTTNRPFTSKMPIQDPYQALDSNFDIQGTQKTLHEPLQNNDPEYLSNFITQMYHTTNQQNIVNPQKLHDQQGVYEDQGPQMVPQTRDLQYFDSTQRNQGALNSSKTSLNPVSSADRFVGNTLNVAASEGTAFVEEKEVRKSSAGGNASATNQNAMDQVQYMSRTLESNQEFKRTSPEHPGTPLIPSHGSKLRDKLVSKSGKDTHKKQIESQNAQNIKSRLFNEAEVTEMSETPENFSRKPSTIKRKTQDFIPDPLKKSKDSQVNGKQDSLVTQKEAQIIQETDKVGNNISVVDDQESEQNKNDLDQVYTPEKVQNEIDAKK